MKDSPWMNDEFARKNISHIDEQFHTGTVQEADFISTELALEKESRLIDLGCGTGRHCIELAKKGYNVVGVDISDVLGARYAPTQTPLFDYPVVPAGLYN